MSSDEIDRLFEKCLSLGPDQLASLLAGLTPEIHDQLKLLLDADKAAHEAAFLRNSAAGLHHNRAPSKGEKDVQDTFVPSDEQSSVQIANYKILQRIGHGGMGEVYMAEQLEPVRRRVALKVIRTEAPTKEVLARFEAERQALAMMDHQNIARVLDAGTTADGRPWFAMELVKGVPITEYCDRNRLPPRERLQLFVQTCRAIQHAHQKGVIHRDLKPSNVLVTLYDGQPVAKVIDFGLAKAIQNTAQLTHRTLFTQFGQIVGTLAYMSPEQAELNALDVDTRTDVYSLGVILYELLTGSTPLSRDRIRTEAFDQVLRLIREEEPPRPSTRLSESGDAITGISQQRQMDPKRLSLILKGDLDWIAIKALEKNRTRRYDTPAALGDDVQRYLNDEAVEARPPSFGYQLQKAVKKHRATFLTGFAVIVLLIAGLAGTGFMYFRARVAEEAAIAEANAARQAEEQATQALDLARKAEEQEREARKNVDREREIATQQEAIAVAVRNFMQNDLLRQADTFQQANSGNVVKKNMTVAELIARAAEQFAPERIEEKFPGQPFVQAEVMATIAEICSALDQHDTAIRFADAVIQKYDENSGGEPVTPQYQVAVLDKLFYQLNSKAFFELSSTAALYVRNLHKTLRLTVDDFDAANGPIDIDREIDERIDAIIGVAIRRSDPANFVLPILRINPPKENLSGIITELSQLPAMIRDIEHDLLSRYGPEDRRVNLGLWQSGALDNIIASIRIHAESYGLGFLLSGFGGSHESCIEKYEAVRTNLIAQQDKELESLIAGLEMIIAVVRRQNSSPQDDPRILQYFQSSLHFLQSYLKNKNHPAINLAKGHVASTLTSLGRYDEAAEILTGVLESQCESLGSEDPQTLMTLDDLAFTYEMLADSVEEDTTAATAYREQAATYYKRLLTGLDAQAESTEGVISEAAVSKLEDRAGICLFDLQRFNEASEIFKTSWEFRKLNLRGEDTAEYLTTLGLLARSLELGGQVEEAIEAQLELCELRSTILKPPSETAARLSRLRAAQILAVANRSSESAAALEELGFTSLNDARLKVIRGEPFERLIRWELHKCGWKIVDFHVDHSNSQLEIHYAAHFPHETLLRYGDPVEESAAEIIRLKEKGYTELKRETWTQEDTEVVTTLWQKPVSSGN